MYKGAWYVIHIDYEDPDWSDVQFIGKNKKSCISWIKKNFYDYIDGGWDDEDELPSFIEEFNEDEAQQQLKLFIRQFKGDN